MNLWPNEQERTTCSCKKTETTVFYASLLLLIMNFVIILSKYSADRQLL